MNKIHFRFELAQSSGYRTITYPLGAEPSSIDEMYGSFRFEDHIDDQCTRVYRLRWPRDIGNKDLGCLRSLHLMM